MTEVVGIRFKPVGKVYTFDPAGQQLPLGKRVIVETARGTECGFVAKENYSVPDEELIAPLKPILRVATEADLKMMEANKAKEARAFQICEEKIKKHGLDMKLIEVEYAFDGSKILFYFTADGRVDFRELVKDLASVFKTRIELRQIGVRDEAKMVGTLGACGRPCCCREYLSDFHPVSIKMAKEQNLSLNPTKISGTCGRLMCCLQYEHEAYEHLIRVTPKVGAYVNTREGRGVVTEVNLITGMLKIRLDHDPDAAPVSVHRKQVRVLRDGAKASVSKAERDALKGIEKD